MSCLSFRRSILLGALCFAPFNPFGLPAGAQSSSPRPIAIDDYFAIKSVHDPQLSPDGKWVAYAVDTATLKTDKNETRIWMVPVSGGDSIPLTAESVDCTHPRWSPDNKSLAFLSDRKGSHGKKQVWLLSRQGGEAQRLTDTMQSIEDFAWSPDSRRLVLVLRDPTPEEAQAAKDSKVHPDAGAGAAADDGSDAQNSGSEQKKSTRPWVIDRLQFKADEVGYLDRRRTHLYIFDVSAKSLIQITSGDYDDSEPAWSPDSRLIAFASNRSTPDPDANYNSDIWTVSAFNTDTGTHLTQITTNPGEDKSPTWSPDGKSLAYVTTLEPKLFQYATYHLAISPATGGNAKVLTQSLDRMVSSPRFASDGSIYFIADIDGELQLRAAAPPYSTSVPVEALGKMQQMTHLEDRVFRSVNGFSVSSTSPANAAPLVIAQVTTPERPDELYSIIDGKYTQLTHVNDALFSQLQIARGEYVHFQSKDGTPVSGYLYKPLNYVPGQKYPVLLVPHGGPVWAYYAEFSHLAQLYAANGYLVLFPNPRGSSGYGQDFCKAIFADWGNKDFQDDMAMVDYAIAQGLADPDKLGVGGHSYGAISTDFIIAQTTRFKAAISDAGAAEFLSLYGHDEYQRDYEIELGLPWEKPEAWIKVSPYRNITKVKTPTLFMGGSSDWNVPILGGEQMYQALRRLGVPTELVVYPDEPHEFTLPSHIQDRLRRHLAWYAHYVKGDATPARPAETEPTSKSSN
jgi:dipeptidyl aminopeptidase/acylaminoacyl peptidase